MRLAAAAVLAAGLIAIAGCSDDDQASPEPDPAATKPPAATSPAPPTSPARETARPSPARCPAGLPGCRSASGRVLYVERVDPDGDGDAHFVLASRDSITGPGLSVVDVRRDLRPEPLPGPGDRISAAGPVYEGSYGQSQIEAVVVNVAPPAG